MGKPTPTAHPATPTEPAHHPHPTTPPAPRPSLLNRRLAHLLHPIAPMISITTHTVHSAFPRTLLAYHLLTSPQLDALAEHYHQSSPKLENWSYPTSVAARWRVVNHLTAPPTTNPTSHLEANPNTTTTIDPLVAAIMGLQPRSGGSARASSRTKASIHDRRRRFGRFIGLRGCDSPGLSAEEKRRQDQAWVEMWVEAAVGRKGGSRGGAGRGCFGIRGGRGGGGGSGGMDGVEGEENGEKTLVLEMEARKRGAWSTEMILRLN